MSRPASTWKCRWCTDWPACSPQLETTRKSVTPKSFVTCAMTSKAWATTAEFSGEISPQEPMWALGMTRKWVGRLGVDVVKGVHQLVLVNLVGGDLPRRDFAKQTIAHAISSFSADLTLV